MSEIRYAVATREGTSGPNADAAAIHRVPGTDIVGAAIVDGIGHAPGTPEWAQAAAEVAARVGPRKTATIGILAAAELNAAPAGASIEPDGVAVLAVAEPGRPTLIAWTGDSQVFGWDGEALHRRSTQHTVGEYLRANGFPVDATVPADDWIRTTLGRCSIATVHAAEIDDKLVILTSDGVHDQMPHEVLDRIVRDHLNDLQAMADAIVAAAEADGEGYRDDATVVVMARAQ